MRLSSTELDWLSLLTDEAKKRTKDEEKIAGLTTLLSKLEKIKSVEYTPTASAEDEEQMYVVIERLQDLTEQYTSNTDLSMLEFYDNIKKEMGAMLEYLSSLRDLYLSEAEFLEDFLKKELRSHLYNELLKEAEVKGERFVATTAERSIDIDQRYLQIKDLYRKVSKIALMLKTKYDLYVRMWQMVFQSCSTASKAKFTSENE